MKYGNINQFASLLSSSPHTDTHQEKWVAGTPNGEVLLQLTNVHEIINKILELIPM